MNSPYFCLESNFLVEHQLFQPFDRKPLILLRVSCSRCGAADSDHRTNTEEGLSTGEIIVIVWRICCCGFLREDTSISDLRSTFERQTWFIVNVQGKNTSLFTDRTVAIDDSFTTSDESRLRVWRSSREAVNLRFENEERASEWRNTSYLHI
jgi:hypothetical protein